MHNKNTAEKILITDNGHLINSVNIQARQHKIIIGGGPTFFKVGRHKKKKTICVVRLSKSGKVLGAVPSGRPCVGGFDMPTCNKNI